MTVNYVSSGFCSVYFFFRLGVGVLIFHPHSFSPFLGSIQIAGKKKSPAPVQLLAVVEKWILLVEHPSSSHLQCLIFYIQITDVCI